MNISRNLKAVAASILSVGFVSFSQAGITPTFSEELFEDSDLSPVFNTLEDPFNVSDLGTGDALRLQPSTPIYSDGIFTLNPDLQSIWDSAIGPTGLDFDSAPFDLDGPFINGNFPNLQSVDLLYSEVFTVDSESLVFFDYGVNVPLFPPLGNFAYSFYFLLNDLGEYSFEIFGESWEGSDSGTKVFGVGDGDPLTNGEKYFLAIGAVHGFDEGIFEDIDRGIQQFRIIDQDPYSLDIDNLKAIQAVPEPSTYGLIGGAFLAGLIGYRRFKAKKAMAAAV